ncbi:MAG: RNA methyltransferase [Victivallales bacterium]|nr:RNA methyltransferase [Victivallales bacterium]
MLSSREKSIIAAMSNRHLRKKQPFFIAEGLRVCREAVTRQPGWVRLALLTEDFAETALGQEFLAECLHNNIRSETVANDVFAPLVETETPQGVLCLCDRPSFGIPEMLPKPFALILDQISEPGNFGTILRTAWAVGLQTLWLVKGGTDPYAPKVVRSGMGAQFALSFVLFDSLAAARDALFHLGGKRLWCTEESADISVFDEKEFVMEESGLVIGNEANGISDTSLGTPVTIPMPGKAESLNVAQAATVFLFEAVRRNLF